MKYLTIIQWKWEIDKGLDLIDRVPDELWTESSWHCTGDRDQDHPQEKEMQKRKMVVWGGLTNSCEENSRKTFTSASLTMLKPLTMCITTNCGIFLTRWEYQTTLHTSWETCMQVKKKQNLHGTTDWFKFGKGVPQGCVSSPSLFNFYAEYIMRNAGLDESWIKIARRNINNWRYADETTLMAENEEELKSLLMKVKEESENAGLKLNIQKPKIMASSLTLHG